jgi:hypothetical protein
MRTTTEDPRFKLRGQVALRQGDIVEIGLDSIPSDVVTGLGTRDANLRCVVVSHDCDIAAKASIEPVVEFIPLQEVRRLESSKTHTKNARSLQFEARASSSDSTGIFQVDAPKKISIEKSHLWDLRFVHPYTLEEKQVREFAEWLSARYRRAALPNNFEDRYARVKKSFWNLIQDKNDAISAVLFVFDEGQSTTDLSDDEPYTMVVLLVHPEGSPSSAFDELVSSINLLFENTYGNGSVNDAGIEIRSCSAISESALSVANYKKAIHHRVEWMSYESDPVGPMI